MNDNTDPKARRIELAKKIADKIYEWASPKEKEKWSGSFRRAYNHDYKIILKILEDHKVIILINPQP